MNYADFLRLKGLDADDVPADQAFRYGQVSVVALMADYLHISLSWDNWENSLDRLFANAEQSSGGQESQAE